MQTISYIDRKSGKTITETPPGQGVLKFSYGGNPLGKLSLHLFMKRKMLSSLGGWYMNRKASAKNIDSFVERENIQMQDFVVPKGGYQSFNDFFYRKIKEDARPIADGFISPADGKILVFPEIKDQQQFFIKGSDFNLRSFLQDDELAKKYEGGSMVIVRLAPVDYHRFHFSCEGPVSDSTPINGHYYSVSPLALRQSLEIFCQNKREYSIQQSEEYGDILYCEVGATMVGSILQTYQTGQSMAKGSEKGYFAFGGSTTVILAEKGRLQFDKDLIDNTANQLETSILMGERIAMAPVK